MGDASEGNNDSPVLPPPPKPKSSLMDMISQAKAKAADTVDGNEKDKEEENKKMGRARRKSRDLEVENLGMWGEDHENLKKLFDELDPTGDGFIPASDLQGALEKAGKKQTTEDVNAALRSLGKPANGKIDFDEFKGLLNATPSSGRPKP